MQAVYSGVVSDSYDWSGLFGRGAGASLGGLPYRLTYTYDTARGHRFTDLMSDELFGGIGYDLPTPIISVVLAIGGVSQSILGTDFAYARQSGGVGYHYLDHYAQDDIQDFQAGTVSQNYAYQWGYDYSNALPVNLDVPFVVHGLTATGAAGGNFGFFTYDFAAAGYSTYTYGSLYPDSLSVSAVTPAVVPLPGGAGLFVLSLGALGMVGLARRRVRS